MKVSFYNIGCKVNLADISKISKEFKKLGHEIVDYGQDADIVLINTCTVTNNADVDARKITRRTIKNLPDAFVGVLGCYAQIKPEEIAAIEGVDAVIGTKDKFSITDLFKDFKKREVAQILVSDLDDAPFHTSATVENEARTRVMLKLQDGCDYPCTYCTIPLARGKSRSMDFVMIQSELDSISKKGYYEVILSGINLGEYKAITGERFKDVVKLISARYDGMRYRISSIEPNMLNEDIIDTVFSSANFCNHFHIPLQSGSPELLKLMKRRYSRDKFESLIRSIKDSYPDCCIGIDVIVGFPGETDKRFRETYSFLESLPFSYLHVFTYSERDNTPAALFEGKVPKHVRKHRTNRLRELSDKRLSDFYASQVGKKSRVLPEKYDESSCSWSGWTDNYVRVHFNAPSDLISALYSVKITSILDDKVIAELI